MTGNALLDLFECIDDSYVLEAIDSRSSAGGVAISCKWIVLAAAIAAAMLLMGCAAAYLWMNGQVFATLTVPKYLNDPGGETPIHGTEERQVATMIGLGDTPANQALMEWYSYTENYEPDDTQEEVPEQYTFNYSCWLPEMAEKLDSIAAKYDLMLLESPLTTERYQLPTVMEQLGWDKLLKPESGASYGQGTALLYPPYNLKIVTDLQLPSVPSTTLVLGTLYYHHKDYMPAYRYWVMDSDSMEQWEYVTTDGTKVYMAYSKEAQSLSLRSKYRSAVFLAEQPEGYMMVSLNFEIMGDTDFEPTRQLMEQLAECFDFTLMPRRIDAAAMQAAVDATVNESRVIYDLSPELCNAYIAYLKNLVTEQPAYRAWEFAVRDVNNDGSFELLLGVDGQVRQVLSPDSKGTPTVIQVHDVNPENLYWRPVLQFQCGDGQYLGNRLLEVDGAMPNDRLPQVYASEYYDSEWGYYTHYRIFDANGDGVDDLLLSIGGKNFESLWSYTCGRVTNLLCADPFYFCGEGVIAYETIFGRANGGYMKGVKYYSLRENTNTDVRNFLAYVAYDDMDKVWCGGTTEANGKDMVPISEAEANAILAKYQRMDQQMRPIAELLAQSYLQ